MQLKIYKLATFFLFPLIFLYLLWRKHKGKEDNLRINERYGKTKLNRPKGDIIWFHAASVGEAMSILPLITMLADSDKQILITTTTVTSARLLQGRLPDNVIHQYNPIDVGFCVERFLRHWQPSQAFFVDSELWPNMIDITHRHNIALNLINARLSDKSYSKLQKHSYFANDMLQKFSHIFVQSEQDRQRFISLGANNVEYIGNLKYDAPILQCNNNELNKLISHTQDRTILLAVSTRKGEELILANIYSQLKEKHPDLLLIIAPRHSNRSGEIISDINHLNIKLRSKNQNITPNTDIYLADSLGELGLFCRLSNIVIMGGSIKDYGGQNPMEPIRLQNAIIAGQYTSNFAELYSELSQNDAAIITNNVTELHKAIDTLLKSPNISDKLASNAIAFAKSKQGILQKHFDIISTQKYK